jgi:hypothetical protein
MKETLTCLFVATILLCCQQTHRIPETVEASAQFVRSPEQADDSSSLPSLSLSKDDYISWIKDVNNGLYQREKIDELEFSVLYKPLPYVVLQELISSEAPLDSFNAYRQLYEGFQYFTFTIRSLESPDILKHGLTDAQEYTGRVDYFSFRMQPDLQLVDGTDTLACRIFHYERTYQVAPYTHFLIAFENSDNSNSDKTLVYHDQVFGKGIVKLKIKASALNKIPNLLLK